MKRFISTVVAIILAVSALSMPSFAANLHPDATFVVTSQRCLPTIDVIIPTKLGFVINPYNMKIKLRKNEDAVTSDVVALYGTSYGTPDMESGDEGETSWKVINNSTEAPVMGLMYATYRANNKLQVNAEGGDVDGSKRQLTLNLTVANKNVPLLKTKPSNWESADVISFTLARNTGSGDANKADIVLTGSTVSGDQAWTDKDSCSITMVFKFYPLSN